MLDRIQKALLPLKLRVSAVSANRIAEIRTEFETKHNAGEISDLSYQIMMNLTAPDETFASKSVLVVAMPSPPFELLFRYEGKTHMALIPPTYLEYEKRPPIIEALINDALAGTGMRASRQDNLPVKLLAVRSGLAQYGRNNITYVEGMGSYVYLSSYLTDMPCEEQWREEQRMAQCDNCVRCINNCPTGAIRDSRRCIEVEKCLTWHNERNSATPFPDWLDQSAHNSIVGCMRCQSVCPANRAQLGQQDGPVEFDEEETALLLDGPPLDNLPEPLREKLEQMCMNTFYDSIARNLRVLIS